MTYVYGWKDGTRFSLDPQPVGERLEKLPKRTPETVLEDAKDEASPLHPAFEWNDDKAAECYRMDQARLLLRSITIVRVNGQDNQPKEPVRAFVCVQTQADAEREYLPLAMALSDEQLRQQVLQEALAEASAWQRRYRQYDELGRVFSAIDETSRRVRRGISSSARKEVQERKQRKSGRKLMPA